MGKKKDEGKSKEEIALLLANLSKVFAQSQFTQAGADNAIEVGQAGVERLYRKRQEEAEKKEKKVGMLSTIGRVAGTVVGGPIGGTIGSAVGRQVGGADESFGESLGKETINTGVSAGMGSIGSSVTNGLGSSVTSGINSKVGSLTSKLPWAQQGVDSAGNFTSAVGGAAHDATEKSMMQGVSKSMGVKVGLGDQIKTGIMKGLQPQQSDVGQTLGNVFGQELMNQVGKFTAPTINAPKVPYGLSGERVSAIQTEADNRRFKEQEMALNQRRVDLQAQEVAQGEQKIELMDKQLKHEVDAHGEEMLLKREQFDELKNINSVEYQGKLQAMKDALEIEKQKQLNQLAILQADAMSQTEVGRLEIAKLQSEINRNNLASEGYRLQLEAAQEGHNPVQAFGMSVQEAMGKFILTSEFGHYAPAGSGDALRAMFSSGLKPDSPQMQIVESNASILDSMVDDSMGGVGGGGVGGEGGPKPEVITPDGVTPEGTGGQGGATGPGASVGFGLGTGSGDRTPIQRISPEYIESEKKLESQRQVFQKNIDASSFSPEEKQAIHTKLMSVLPYMSAGQRLQLLDDIKTTKKFNFLMNKWMNEPIVGSDGKKTTIQNFLYPATLF